MWADSLQPRTKKDSRRGFTIVELLIVIVVIAILATITIVAYNGITQRARVATVSGDLEGATKQLAIDQTINGSYPDSLSNANEGKGIKSSPGTTLQYIVNNSANPQTFCLTAINETTIYHTSNSNNIPTSGGCEITNLVTNPSYETNVTGWGQYGGVSNLTSVSTTPYDGTARLSAVGNNTAKTPRVQYILPVTSGQTVSILAHMRSDGQTPRSSLLVVKIRFNGAEVGIPIDQQHTWTTDVNGWAQESVTYTVPANVDALAIQPGLITDTNYTGTMGVDGVMAVLGTSTGSYADGSSPDWSWNGTPNASTSTGPMR